MTPGPEVVTDTSENIYKLRQIVNSEEIKNSAESRCSFKIESNSRGNNYTTHVYAGCTYAEINDAVVKAIYAHNLIQNPEGEKKKDD